MSATLFKEVSYSLSKLLADIDMGEIGLPELQRPFVWPNAKVRDLFDSMYKGFPVGYLLFWSNGTGSGHRQIGTDTKQKVPRLLIVDGQQRLTSLYAVLKGLPVLRENYKSERIYIAFRPRDHKFEVADAAIVRDPEYIPDTSKAWSKEILPHQFLKEFLANLRLSREVSEEEENELAESIDQLHDLHNYPFTALELSSTVSEEDVSDVFVRVNSKGTILNQADFILTLMSVFWDAGRSELERFCKNSRQPATSGPSPYNYFIQPDPDQLLRVDIGLGFRRARLQHVYNILRGKDLETEEFSDDRREEQFGILRNAQDRVLDLQSWHNFQKCLLRAGYRSADMITSQTSLLYAYVFYLIGKHDYGLDEHTLRDVISRWYFMTSLTSHYSGSFETNMEQDLSRLRDVPDGATYVAHLNRTVSETLTEDFWKITLPNLLDTSSARTPPLFAHYAALNLLNAYGLYSNIHVSDLLDPALKAHKSALERHHLFPKGYLAKLDISEKRITNQVANFALVEWSDNIEISDQAPKEYIFRYEKRFSPEELKDMYFWHGLPENWQEMDYLGFLAERRKRIAKVIQAGFETL